MPEFIAEMVPSDLPDEFTQGYMEAIEWLLSDSGDTESGKSDRELATGFAPETIQQAIETCRKFQEANAADLAAAYESGYSESTAGVDLWLTRNGHSAGYWGRGLWEIGDRLTKATKTLGHVDSYVGDDGLIYLDVS